MRIIPAKLSENDNDTEGYNTIVGVSTSTISLSSNLLHKILLLLGISQAPALTPMNGIAHVFDTCSTQLLLSSLIF